MDNEIIYSWCFNYVECSDSTPSTAIIVLVKKLGELVEPQIQARGGRQQLGVVYMTMRVYKRDREERESGF